MSEKHLIALDLDGTLLKDDKTISDTTKKVIQKARLDGHIVVIATGRPYRSSEVYYKELALNTPVVNFNGAFVHHPLYTDWGVHHSPLDIKIAKEIIDACQNFQFHNIVAEVINDVYLHRHDDKLLSIFGMGDPVIKSGDLLHLLNDSPTSLLIHTDEEHIKTIRDHLAAVHAEVIDQRSWATPWPVIEIVRHGLNKATGLKMISEYVNIPKDRIIAFGDEDNDLEMLEYAGFGIAMGNAIPSVKNIANETTMTNEEDGIAIYLNDKLNLKIL